jgi:hypothetical protein
VLWREYGAGVNFSIEIPKCKIQEHHNIKVSRSRLELSWLVVVSTFFQASRDLFHLPVSEWVQTETPQFVEFLKNGSKNVNNPRIWKLGKHGHSANQWLKRVKQL